MNKSATIFDCKILELKKVHNRAGNMTLIDSVISLPFQISRVYYIYDIPAGESRGGHAHKELHQLIVAASGSFDILFNDSTNRKSVNLNKPYYGLYVVPGIWRELVNFSSGSTCLVIASHKYDKDDYIRNYKNFLQWKSVK